MFRNLGLESLGLHVLVRSLHVNIYDLQIKRQCYTSYDVLIKPVHHLKYDLRDFVTLSFSYSILIIDTMSRGAQGNTLILEHKVATALLITS